MRAIRKREAEPGLVLDELPVPTPGPDEVLVRIEAASICGTDLHINRWDTWSSEARQTAADARPRALRDGGRGRKERVERRGGRVRVGREPRHVRGLLPLPDRERAHVRADADPRRRPRRRLRRLRRRARVRRLDGTTARSSRRRSPASRSRSGTPSSRPRRRSSRGARSRSSGAARSACSRSRSRGRSAPAGCSRPTTCRSGSSSRRASARTTS